MTNAGVPTADYRHFGGECQRGKCAPPCGTMSYRSLASPIVITSFYDKNAKFDAPRCARLNDRLRDRVRDAGDFFGTIGTANSTCSVHR
jgi:hypothetical protein